MFQRQQRLKKTAKITCCESSRVHGALLQRPSTLCFFGDHGGCGGADRLALDGLVAQLVDGAIVSLILALQPLHLVVSICERLQGSRS